MCAGGRLACARRTSGKSLVLLYRSLLNARLNPDASVLGELFARDVVASEPGERPLTDDRAPVEWLTDQMIASYIVDGGEGIDEDFLPTRP